jgi:hypothetical protein
MKPDAHDQRCRRRIEMSPGVQSRDDTPAGKKGPARPRITAKARRAERQPQLARMDDGGLGSILGVEFVQRI